MRALRAPSERPGRWAIRISEGGTHEGDGAVRDPCAKSDIVRLLLGQTVFFSEPPPPPQKGCGFVVREGCEGESPAWEVWVVRRAMGTCSSVEELFRSGE